MSNKPTLAQPEKAFFTVKNPPGKIVLDFNPVTLQMSVESKTEGGEKGKVQHVTSSSAKLDLEMVFDSTDSGQDVRRKTQPLERLLDPGKGKPMPTVTFEWGAFSFEGCADSFKQTLDFFSRDGVPLRAVVGMSISQKEHVFARFSEEGKPSNVNDTLELAGGSPAAMASAGGDPGAARRIAGASGLESLRAEAQGRLTVGGGVSIGAAAAFSASASAGMGGGIGIGIGANVGVGGAASVGGGVGAGFAGLQGDLRVASGAGNSFDASRIIASVPVAASAGAGFDVSGRVSLGAGSGFRADVSGGVRFDEA